MRLILVDRPTAKRINFYPLALSRPIWELRCGMTSLGEKLVAKLAPSGRGLLRAAVHGRVYRAATAWPVNDPRNSRATTCCRRCRVKAADFAFEPTGPSQVACDADGEVLFARIAQADLAQLDASSIDALLDSAKATLPAPIRRCRRGTTPGTWCWPIRRS